MTAEGRLRERLATAGPLAAGAAAALCSLTAPTPTLLSPATADPVGYFLTFGGLILLHYPHAHPLEPQLRADAPPLRRSLRMGPYALIRQPVALAILAAFAGSALLRQSLPGLLTTLLALAPFLLWRARRQERNLAARFGERWEHYAAVTGVILPIVPPSKRPPTPPVEG
jgi:protein-S-isoprenylcysteine O-methyltransferase Ste14